MTQHELWKRWQVTKSYLRFAAQLLPDSLIKNDGGDSAQEIGSLHVYNEYLEHNELGLALDQLEEVGELNTVPPAYWKNLANAAQTMELNERAGTLMDKFEFALTNRAVEQRNATEPCDAPKSRGSHDFESSFFGGDWVIAAVICQTNAEVSHTSFRLNPARVRSRLQRFTRIKAADK